MKDIETVVSENIKKLLKEYNINQSQLSKIAGVSESTVGKWILKKATPRMGAIQKISDYFNLPKSYILEEKDYKLPAQQNEYYYFDDPVSAGIPINIDSISEKEAKKISIPDNLMGKWAGHKDIRIMKVNGESMNCVMPDQSIIAVKPTSIDNLQNGDIVVYHHDYEYSTKRFINDKENKRLIFRPDSTDIRFTEHVIDYEDADNLVVEGKVVMWIVVTD